MQTAAYRHRVWWIVCSVSALLSLALAAKLFPYAFPVVHINLKTNREDALSLAQTIATQQKIGPQEYDQAASFETDHLVKAFVELECGGKAVFVEMIQHDRYEPYVWQVRHFKEYEIEEASFFFTPGGNPYGFTHTISENYPGRNLSRYEAQQVAEERARTDWNINFDLYELVESSKEIRPSKRSDHTFTYERKDVRIGEGYYRLQLVVSGNRLTSLTPQVKVPESFIQRYQEMRSSNNTIANVAQMLTLLLYSMICCAVGFILLFRKRRLLWRAPLIAAFCVALLNTLNTLNTLPLCWMNFDTALSKLSFFGGLFTSLSTSLLTSTASLFILFMLAESLTRFALPNHIQLWKTWTLTSLSSLQTIKQTASAYIVLCFFFTAQILFYAIATQYLGWWMPSNSLHDPNILATYFPWLGTITFALQSGPYEESLYRAIPLASAMLFSKRFKHRKPLLMICVFVLHAFIFGAVHANYPQQPAYFRIIEMILPSFLLGATYIYFGLMPAIITHTSFNMIWSSLPIFISHASGALTNKLLIILIGFMPLWIILYAVARRGLSYATPTALLNTSWIPTKRATKVIRQVRSTIVHLSALHRYLLISTAFIGVGIWAAASRFTQDAPPLTISRNEAIALAEKKAIELFNLDLTLWHPLTHAHGSENTLFEQRFIWQSEGKDLYRRLLGQHLDEPEWVVRFARFSGTVEERTEEFRILIAGDGNVSRILHRLPESQPGAKLSKQEARAIALVKLQETFGLEQDELHEVSATSTKQEHRIDWLFTFANDTRFLLEQGEARIDVKIGGDTVIDVYRYIHIPEEWERNEHRREFLKDIVSQICAFVPYLLFLAAGILSVLRVVKGPGSTTLIAAFFFFLSTFFLQFINRWPSIVMLFNTQEPFFNQLIQLIGPATIGLLIKAAILASVIVFASSWKPRHTMHKTVSLFTGAWGVGMLCAGLQSCVKAILPRARPLWADYNPLGTYLPLFSSISSNVIHYITLSLILVLLFILLSYFMSHCSGQVKKILPLIFSIFFGLVISGSPQPIDTFPLFFASGTLMGILTSASYWAFIRYDYALIPVMIAGYRTLRLLQQAAFGAFPQATLGALLSIVATIAFAWGWYTHVNTPNKPQTPSISA